MCMHVATSLKILRRFLSKGVGIQCHCVAMMPSMKGAIYQFKQPESFLVQELALAAPDRRSELLNETFEERRRWIMNDGPGMVDILSKFSSFLRFPEEVSELIVTNQLI